MLGNTFRQHFQVMGADVDVAADGERFEIGIDQGELGETFFACGSRAMVR